MSGAAEPLRSELRIAAPPELVFAYFTDPARLVDWMGLASVLDPRPGGTFRVEPNGRDVVVGEYLELDPPHRVVFSWGFAGPDAIVAAGSTRIEVTLEPDGKGTWLVLLHHDLGSQIEFRGGPFWGAAWPTPTKSSSTRLASASSCGRPTARSRWRPLHVAGRGRRWHKDDAAQRRPSVRLRDDRGTWHRGSWVIRSATPARAP
jgi:uncharacterized protein YndB with AHSA1/START domain